MKLPESTVFQLYRIIYTLFESKLRSSPIELDFFKQLTIDPAIKYKEEDIVVFFNAFIETFRFWNIENPSLDTLAQAVTLLLLNKQLDSKIYIEVLNGINYFGLFGLIEKLDISEEIIFNQVDKIKVCSKIAKYYKEAGNIEKAHEYYRKTHEIACNLNEQDIIAYTLTLLSKFYDDYFQRRGLSLAYNQIAFNKVKDGLEQSNIQINRFVQIIIDSHAKAIYPTNKLESDKLFLFLLSQKFPFEIHSRIEFRFLEKQVDSFMMDGNIELVCKSIKRYEKLLSKVNNPKAHYIRKIKLLRIYRFLYNTEYRKFNNKALITLIDELISGGALAIIDDCISKANYYSDRKNLAYAYYEQYFWIDILNKPPKKYGVQFYSFDSLTSLINGLELFSQIPQRGIINTIYFKLLKQISKHYILQQDWKSSSYYYTLIYEYTKMLVNELANDKSNIEKYLQERRKPQKHYSTFTELLKFSNSELHLIKESLLYDFEELTQHLIHFGENIQIIQKQSLNRYPEIIFDNKKLIGHDINREINFIKNRLFDFNNSHYVNDIGFSNNVQQIKSAINNIQVIYNKWDEKAIHEILSPSLIDLKKIIDDQIKIFSENKQDGINISIREEIPEEIKIKHLNFLLCKLIDNLIINAIQTGQRNQLLQISLLFTVEEIDKILYLAFYDNCGEVNSYMNVIAILNSVNDNFIPSMNRREGGQGLKLLKKDISYFFKDNIDWKIVKLTDNEKIVKIPIIKL